MKWKLTHGPRNNLKQLITSRQTDDPDFLFLTKDSLVYKTRAAQREKIILAKAVLKTGEQIIKTENYSFSNVAKILIFFTVPILF